MIENKLIAQNITNLTDARYFAAWGVDYISFNTQSGSEFEISLEDIKEIADWIEGPKVLIESNSLEFDEIADGYILDNIYSSLPISKESFFRTSLEEVQKSLPAGNYIIKLNSTEELETVRSLNEGVISNINLYLDISDIKLTEKASLGHHGLVIQGGEEEKAGVKSFDELDELYDILMD